MLTSTALTSKKKVAPSIPALDKFTNLDDGINFYYKEKAHASELMNFVQNQCVVKIKQSAKLISHNEKTGNVNSKFTIMIDIAPVCKDDLVLLPGKLSRECGGIGPLVL